MYSLHSRGLRIVAGVAALGISTIACVVRAGPATQPSSALDHPGVSCGQIDVLLAQLTDPRWPVRSRAVERLVEIGPAAERQLLQARDSATTVDVRMRVEMILRRIHDARRSGPTYISLHLTGAASVEALGALAAAAAVRFDTGGIPAGRSITLQADHQPFWRVLRDLCSQSGLEVAAIDPSGTILLRGGDDDWGRRPAVIQGPYMLLARRIDLARSLDLANPRKTNNAYTLVLLAYAEPKLRPIYWSVTEIDHCVTETGHALELQSDGFEPGDLNADSETRLQFDGPADVGTRLARLRLSARFVLCDKSQRVDVANILKVKNETQTVSGWRITIKGVTKNEDDHYAAGITVYRDNHTPEEWTELTGMLDRMQPRLLDSAGKVMESGGTSLNQGPDEWNWSDECTPASPDQKPAKLLWDFPLETRHADVTFEFKDLPLP